MAAKNQVPVFIVCERKEYRTMQASAVLLKEVLPNSRRLTMKLGKRASMAEEHNWA